MDLVVKSPRIPVPGETILGGDFLMVPGGKGANQAVAAARLGARVCFVTRLGDDLFGRESLENFQREGLDTRFVTLTSHTASGVALITVDDVGNNAIVVAPGANAQLSPEDVYQAEAEIRSAGAVVVQLEVPMTAVQCAAELANEAGVPFILNPAPAPVETQNLASLRALLARVEVLTPNEIEAQILTGVEVVDDNSACEAVERLLSTGVKAVILTMGAKGFLLAADGTMEFVPALKVKAIDATAAGDAFTGSLAVSLAQGRTLREAGLFANRVAGLCVTRLGAQPSMPTRKEVEEFAA